MAFSSYQLVICYAASIFLFLMLKTESSYACQTESSTKSAPSSSGTSKTVTYYHCYEVATANVRCAQTGSTNACPSPAFRTWGSQTFSDVNSCAEALGIGPYFFARTGLVYATRPLAQEACEKYEGAKLAVIHSTAEYNMVTKAAAELYTATHNDQYTSFWLGLNYDTASQQWFWYDDKSIATINSSLVDAVCTPGTDADCNCAYSDYNGVTFPNWCNSPDGYTAYVLCYGQKKLTPPVSQVSSKYFLTGNVATGLASPTAASTACRAAGGALATIKTQAQLLESISTFGKNSMEALDLYPGVAYDVYRYWINLQYSNGAWKWQDNMTLISDVNIVNWSPKATPGSPATATCTFADEASGAWLNSVCDVNVETTTYGALCMKF